MRLINELDITETILYEPVPGMELGHGGYGR